MGNLPQEKNRLSFKGSKVSSIPKVTNYPKLRKSVTEDSRGRGQSNPKGNSIEYTLMTKSQSKISDKREISFIMSILSTHPLFKYIDNDQIKSTWIKKFYSVTLGKNNVLYSQNTNAESAYLLYKGTITLTYKETKRKNSLNELYESSDDQNDLFQSKKNEISIKEINKTKVQPKIIKEGEYFGEFEVVNKMNRIYTAISIQGAMVFGIPGEVLNEIIKLSRKKNSDKIKNFIKSYFPNIESLDDVNQMINEHLVIWNYKTEKIPLIYSECIYIIFKGEVGTYYQKEKAKTLRKGDVIGYRELIKPNAFRNIQLETITECEVFTISFFAIMNSLKSYIEQMTFFAFCLCFNQSNRFNSIEISVLCKIFPLFTLHDYSVNEVIFRKGESLKGDIIVLLEGNILQNKNDTGYEAVRNEIYYEKELLYKSDSLLIKEDNYAFPECTILRSNNDKIKGALNGKTLQEVVSTLQKKKMIIDLLKHCKCYNFPKNRLNELEKHIQLEKYSQNVTIINQGSNDLSKIYMIKSGYVSFFVNNVYIRTLGEYSPFGFRALMINSPTRTASAITNGPCELYSINAKMFISMVINDNHQCSNFFKNRIDLENDSITLNDLENVKLLGKGSFGFVNLVRSKKNKVLYSIKAIPLKKIMQYKLYESTLTERNILRILDHNFIMKSVCSLKNNEFVFLVNEYIKGKTLSKLLREIGSFSKLQAQFYIGSLVIIIEYLHSNLIIHRDIKPENIMINDNGYIKMIDFGTAKEIASKDGTAHTIIGTPRYMAPEIIRGELYNDIVDYWSLGICLYELICGKTPFCPDGKDPNEIYKSVLNDPLTFPSNQDKDFINLVSGLLVKDKTKRKFGAEIKKHPWFDGLDWNGIEEMSFQLQNKLGNIDCDESNAKSGNYLSVLKSQISEKGNKLGNQKERELDKYDYEKGEKFLKEF